jgi:hypothetical protein
VLTFWMVALPTTLASAAAPAEQPAPGSKPPLRRSARSGPWSAASTWEGGKIPTAGDRVQIRTSDHVTYDVDSDQPIRSIHVAGTLAFATDRDTRLHIGLIKIQPGDDASENGFDCDAHVPPVASAGPRPALEVGSPTAPVSAGRTARIRLVFCAGMDRESCPAIVCCGGRMDLHGAPLSRTWVKLGATAKAGDTVITLAEPVRGWRVGDRVIVTATQRDRGASAVARAARGKGEVYRSEGTGAADGAARRPLTEERTVRAIAGVTLTLDRPLVHHHLGEGPYRGEVANLSRSVIVESAEPDGVRGHTMYHRGSAGSVSYAEFRHLGKKGVLGRYSLHYHLVGDTMRGSSVVGASIWHSDNRWLTVHGTDYLVVRDCVGYQSVGHGFYLEDGTETYNVFDGNLAVGARARPPLPRQALPFDRNEGAGFWWANCRNTFTGNVACDGGRYGYRFEAVPAAGFDLRRPIREADGSRKPMDLRTVPFVRFEDNEAHGVGYGINLGQETVDRPGTPDRHSGVGPDTRHPFVLRNTKVWNTRWGIRPESPSVLIDGLELYACVYGFYRAKFRDHAYSRVTIGAVALTEAFSTGRPPAGVVFAQGGKDAFQRTGAPFSPAEKARFAKYLAKSWVGLAPADAERLVRGSYHTGGQVDGRPLPPILEDACAAKDSGVSCGPLSSTGYPKPLDPVDDQPPATVITAIRRTPDGGLVVRGTTSDNGVVKRVRLNGRDVTATRPNFAQWVVALGALPPGPVRLVATGEDAAGNVERTPHELVVDVENVRLP